MIRGLHIQAAPTHSLLAKPATAASSFPYGQLPLFTALGQPPTLLQVHLPPSFPVTVGTSSLISLSNVTTTQVKPHWLFKNLLYGKCWRYNTLESTTPAQLLVKGKGLYILSLDGQTDYALFTRSALLSYAGAALRVSTARNTLSGLPWGVSMLQGRGDAVIQGDGEVHKLVLTPGEEVVVKSSSLVGLSVLGKLDGVELWQPANPIEEASTTELVSTETWQHYWHKTRSALRSVRSWVLQWASGVRGFVKISGPRTVLLQSGSSSISFEAKDKPISITEKQLAQAARSQNPQDYLHYATVVNGEVKFSSTPDFKATVEKYTKKDQ